MNQAAVSSRRGSIAKSPFITEAAAYLLQVRDFLFPLECPCCASELQSPETICKKCKNRILNSFFVREGRVNGLGFAYPFPYSDEIRKIIIAYKYGGREELAPFLGSLFDRAIREKGWEERVLFSLPLSKDDVSEGRLDHMALILRYLSGLGYRCTRFIERQKKVFPQASLDREKRLLNLKGAFRAVKKARSTPLLFVDDVITTGATYTEVASVLTGEDIEGIMLAHGS